MKKMIAAILAVLCLAGCSQKIEETPVAEEQPQLVEVEEEPEEIPEEPEAIEVEEIPMTMIEEETEEEETSSEPAQVPAHTMNKVEGLIEDTVGYLLDCPVFADLPAAETINRYYVDLTAQLASFSRESIYSNASKKLVTASVYGIVETMELSDGELKVVYTCRVIYSDKQVDESTRTDYFNIQTGATRSE